MALYKVQNKEGVSLCKNCKIKELLLLYIKCKSRYRFVPREVQNKGVLLLCIKFKEVVLLCMK
jgi:hypothetical protein